MRFSQDSKPIRLKKVIIASICALIAITLAITYNGKAGNARLNATPQEVTINQIAANKDIQAAQDAAEIIATGEDLPSPSAHNKNEETADKIAISYKVFNQFLIILLALFAYDLIKSFSLGLSNLISAALSRISKIIDRKVN